MTEPVRTWARRWGIAWLLVFAGLWTAVQGVRALLAAEPAPAQAPAPVPAAPPGLVQFRPARPAQQPDSADDNPVEGVLNRVKHDQQKTFDRAKQLLGDGRYSEALPLLDDILQSSEDSFFNSGDNKSAQRGLKAEAQRLLSSQPPEGLKAYELLFGPKAQRLLSDALASGEQAGLAEVARRYFNTKAGYEATLLLGRRHLDHDEPLAAALCFQRLRETPAAKTYEPTLSVLLAACWLRGGMESRAHDVLAELKKQSPDATLRIAGKEVRLFGDDSQAVAWLTTNLGAARSGNSAGMEQWAMLRGDPARNASSAGGMPLLNVRWRVPTTERPADEQEVIKSRQENLDRNVPILPVAQPLAVGDVVLMRTSRSLLAVNFTSGKRVWEVRSPGGETAVEQQAMPGMRMGWQMQMQMNGGDPSLSERLWENATGATLSSDGECVFAVEDERPTAVLQANMNRAQVDTPPNELAAYELKTEGKLRWRVGGEGRDEKEIEPKLAGAYFLGPPLPLLGRLYVLAEIKGDIRLEVLDSRSGKLDWEQQLAYVEPNNPFQDAFRRMSGVSPSYADGVIVCPTSVGAVVAVDLANRSLLWGFEYHAADQDSPQQQMIAMRMGMPVNAYPVQSYLGDRWSDATAAIADGCVLVTPIESDTLYCLSLIDGQKKWEAKRDENVYVGGISGGKAILVGRSRVEALSLADGHQLWQRPLDAPVGAVGAVAAAMPSGRGFMSGGHYFLPLSTAEVAQIDMATGQIVARAHSRKGLIPGNLVCFRGDVISQGVDSLDTYYQLEPLRERVAKTLAATPDDPEALARRGEIELDQGKIAEAIADIRRAYAKKADPSTRELLVEGMLAALTENFAAARGSIPELEPLIERDAERSAFLRILADGLQKSGEKLAALEAYAKLVDLPWNSKDLETVEPALSVRRDAWVRARFDDLYGSLSPDERAKTDEAIARRLQTALAAKDPKELRRFLRFFGGHPVADEARAQLFVQLIGPDTLLERESLLRQLERSADAARRRWAVAETALLLQDVHPDEAAIYFRRLSTELADQVCLTGMTGQQIVDKLPAESPVGQVLHQANDWPIGCQVKANEPTPASPRIMRNGNMRPFPVDWRGARPPYYETTNVTITFDQQIPTIVGHDGTGKEKFKIGLGDAGQQRVGVQNMFGNLDFVAADGHLLLVSLGSEVIALDTLRTQPAGNRVLWQQELADMPPNTFNPQPLQGRAINAPWGAPRFVPVTGGNFPIVGGVGPLSGDCVVFQRGHDLVALDPLTGETLWTRHGVQPGCELFGDEQVLIVAPPPPDHGSPPTDGVLAMVLRTRDGQSLGTRRVPNLDQRFGYAGRRLLASHPDPKAAGRFEIVLSDPWQEKQLSLGSFAGDAKGTRVGDDALAMFEPNGRFTLLSLDDGHKLIDEQLEPEPAVHAIHVQVTSNQYLLIVSRPVATMDNARQARFNAQGMGNMADGGAPQVAGHIYAFDRAAGKKLWPSPAFVDEHSAILNQGLDLPVLVLVRAARNNGNPAGGTVKSSLVCLDRRNGRALVDEEMPPGPSFLNLAVEGDRDRKTVALRFPTQTTTLHFTDDPTPPEPPYQAGLAAHQSRLGRTPVGAVLRALGSGAREASGGATQDDPFSEDDDGGK